MITLGFVYVLAGLTFALFAMLGAIDRSNPKRFGNAAFWGLLALSMLAGDYLGDFGNGLLVLALVAIAGAGQIGRAPGGEVPVDVQVERAAKHGNFLLLVALIIPAVALAGTFLFKWIPGLADPKQATLISLALGVLIALGVGMARLKPPPLLPLQQGRRLLDSVGWAAILPQMLASLGAVFALAGVGDVVGGLIAAGYSGREPCGRGHCLWPWNGAVHDGHGQCLCGISGHDRGDRHAPLSSTAAIPPSSRRSACSRASAAR